MVTVLIVGSALLLSILQDLHAVKLKAVKFELDGLPPNLTGPLEKNSELTEAERYKVNELKGPSSFVFYRGQVYAGLADGRIVDISDCGVRTIAKLSAPNCKGETDCGRPLGMRLDSRGRLVVADSSRGIFRINVDTGHTEILFSSETPVNGKKCKFINDVVVAKDGTILFIDSSTRWSYKESPYAMLEGEATGRLLAYSDKSNKTIVVLDNLAFPSGLEFDQKEEYVLISERVRSRIRKLSLKPGKTWLQFSTFAANLPGLPDNIRATVRGTFWVAMFQARHQNMSNMLDEYAAQPQMRDMVGMMSTLEQIVDMSEKYGMVVELNDKGEIIRSLQDPTGNQVSTVSEAVEHDGFLYLGNYDQPFISRVPMSKTFHVERFLQKIKSTCRATKINIGKLRTVLRRLVAIAEFRRALLNAKRRREEEEKLAQKTKPTTSMPSTASSFNDSFTTTGKPLQENTTAVQDTVQNVTETLITKSVQVTTLSADTTVTTSTATTTVGDIESAGAREMETTTVPGGITIAGTTVVGEAIVNPSTEITETG